MSFPAAHASRLTYRGHSWQEAFADSPVIHEGAFGNLSMLGT
ncbi:hypothetical protein [Burkholderia sp. MSMB617WGS]|nr:hypothetical protein [Burkholderia sp. MSMB617WGS]